MYYDKNTVDTCMSGLVGWTQSTDSSHFTLTSANLQSTSGYYVDALPGVKWEYITDMIGNAETEMNNYLSNVFSQESIKLINRSVDSIKDQLKTKELLSNFDPVAGRAAFKDRITQDARFVGFLIMPKESSNLRAEITHIGMQIDKVQSSSLKIYLYDTSQQDAIATFDYQNTKAYSLEWKTVSDFIINYRSTSGGTGQTFLLGYYETDPANPQSTQLEGHALYMDFSTGCCQDAKRKKLLQRYIGIVPIALPNSMLNWSGSDYTLPDTDNLENYTTNRNYGIYIKLNVTCDISHVICMNKDIYAEPLQLAMAVRVLADCLNNTIHNATADAKQVRDNIKSWMLNYKAELYGYQLENGKWHKGAIDRMVLDISNIDDYCLPCKQDKPIIGRVNRAGY